MLPNLNDFERRYLRTATEVAYDLSGNQVEFTGLNQLYVKLPNMDQNNMEDFSIHVRHIFGAFLVAKGMSGGVYVTSKRLFEGVEFRCWYLTASEISHQDSFGYSAFKANKMDDSNPDASDQFVCSDLLLL